MKKQRQSANTTKQFPRVLLIAFIILVASVSQGQEWTRYRGPNGQGISHAKSIPVKWTEKDYNWKVKLPGGGYSSPVLWGDKVFVTSADQKAGHGFLLALRVSDGEVLWQKQYSLTTYRMNPRNSYATATPVVDADHVYALWPTSKETILVALDHDGGEIWQRTFGGVHCQHGAGSSPIVFDDIVVFTHEHEGSSKSKTPSNRGDARSAWIAVDRKTGRTRWELERQTSPKTSYSTPCVYSPATDAPQLIFTSRAHGITSVNPRTGTILWEAESVFPSRVVSSPVIAGQLLIGSCGDGSNGKCLVAVQPGARDKSTQPTEAYTIGSSTAPYVPTSLAMEGLLFTFHDRGYVSCLRSATGEQLWREKPANQFYGSPVWVNGKLYCITTKGEVVVIKAASTYDLLAVNPLGEKSHATPAVAGGRMYLRTYSHLISIGPKKE
ncbi:MAG: PQQ-binding-like beta-propeller repeat protein [Planctomycetes bacterium]|nr:PQQ-binding-like beta-propeller repeat protein [Planctomycetota bacterium]